MKSSPTNPRTYDREAKGWEVDLTHDDQDNCKGCGAGIYWITIKTKAGKVKIMPMSVALATRRKCPDCTGSPFTDCQRCRGTGFITFMAGHHADCSEAKQFGGKK